MLSRPQNYSESVRATLDHISEACAAAGRNVDSVTLLAVSKGQSAAAIDSVARAGVEHFGENFLQESLPKMEALAGRELTWHFIGRLQANKTRPVAENFQWVHGVDRLKIAERLSAARPEAMAPLQVCVQVNVSGEASKSGVAPQEAPALARAVAALPRLRLRGLMAIPEVEGSVEAQRAPLRRLRELLERLRAELPQLDTLSMGMSADLEAAIAEGATIVRVGTGIFGARPKA